MLAALWVTASMARSEHVTNPAESKRFFGTASSKKWVSGTVLAAEFVKSSTGDRGNWIITAEYDFPGMIRKTKKLNGRSIRPGNAPGFTNPESESVLVGEASTSTMQDTAVAERPDNGEGGDEMNGIEAHGYVWKNGPDELAVNGEVPFRPWAYVLPTGEKLGAESDDGSRSFPSYFLAMFPPRQLALMLQQTNFSITAVWQDWHVPAPV